MLEGKEAISLCKKTDSRVHLVVVPDKKEVKRGILPSILKQAMRWLRMKIRLWLT